MEGPAPDHFATLFMVNIHNQGNIFTSGSTNTHTLSRTAGQRVFDCNQLDKYYACATTDLPSCFDAGGLKQQELCLQQESKSKMVLASGRMLSVVGFKCRTYTCPILRILRLSKYLWRVSMVFCKIALSSNMGEFLLQETFQTKGSTQPTTSDVLLRYRFGNNTYPHQARICNKHISPWCLEANGQKDWSGNEYRSTHGTPSDSRWEVHFVKSNIPESRSNNDNFLLWLVCPVAMV